MPKLSVTGYQLSRLPLYWQTSDVLAKQCLTEYMKLFDFANLEFDVCLRQFFVRYKLPGEAQKIDRVMEVHAMRLKTGIRSSLRDPEWPGTVQKSW